MNSSFKNRIEDQGYKPQLIEIYNIMFQQTEIIAHTKSVPSSKIHLRNINLEKAGNNSGMIGERYSRTIDHLVAEVENKTKELTLYDKSNITASDKEQYLQQKIAALQKQQGNLKHQMIRISQMAKTYKTSKIDIETKYQNLLKECALSKTAISDLEAKIELLTHFNTCLIRITENSLEVFPQYEQNCSNLLLSISKLKEDFRQKNIQEGLGALGSVQLSFKKIEHFNSNVNFLQNYKKKLMASILQIHQSTKSIDEHFSMIQNIGLNEVCKLKSLIANLSDEAQFSEGSSSQLEMPNQLCLNSLQVSCQIIPQSTTQLPKILEQISHLFEQHIHLLQTQKMQYQFAKNKKLIASQKYDCQICASYQKIVNEVFSIIREAYKEIKFEFLKQIKGIEDIKEISLLI